MEHLQSIPTEVLRYNPAYEHLTSWLTEEGIEPLRASELSIRSYIFQKNTPEILTSETCICITGKVRQSGQAPSLRFRLACPDFVSIDEKTRSQTESDLQASFAKEIADPFTDEVHTELDFVSDLPEAEDYHIGYIGLTKEGTDELSRRLQEGALFVQRFPEAATMIYENVQMLSGIPEEERPAVIEKLIAELNSRKDSQDEPI